MGQKKKTFVPNKKKKKILKRAVIISLSTITLSILLIQYAYQTIKNKPDNRPVSSFPSDDLFPNPDIPKDENGDIIEDPVNNEELTKSFLVLEQKLIKDAKSFGKKFNFINSIKGIYEHQTLSETSGKKESIIEIIFEADGKLNSLQYMNFGEEEFNISKNDTKIIMEFFNYLSNCYPYDCYTQDEDTTNLLKKLETSFFVAKPFKFTYHSNLQEYRIPSYNKDGSFTLFKTDKNYLDNYDIDPLKALEEYIDNKNQLFSQSTDESEFTTITNACEKALKIIADNPEIALEQEANISQNSTLTEKPFEI